MEHRERIEHHVQLRLGERLVLVGFLADLSNVDSNLQLCSKIKVTFFYLFVVVVNPIPKKH